MYVYFANIDILFIFHFLSSRNILQKFFRIFPEPCFDLDLSDREEDQIIFLIEASKKISDFLRRSSFIEVESITHPVFLNGLDTVVCKEKSCLKDKKQSLSRFIFLHFIFYIIEFFDGLYILDFAEEVEFIGF